MDDRCLRAVRAGQTQPSPNIRIPIKGYPICTLQFRHQWLSLVKAVKILKKKISHIIFPILLIVNLMFGQVALNFLHNPHSEHAPGIKVASAKANIHQHGEHCKICSLDIVLHLLAENPYRESEVYTLEVQVSGHVQVSETNCISSIQDRAPPVIA